MNWSYGNQEPAVEEGRNTFSASPDDMGMMQERALATAGSTTTQEDVERAMELAQRTAETMIAQGYPDEEIQRAVMQLPINTDHVQAALYAAQQSLDAQKFNVFDGRNQQEQQEPQAMGMLAALGGFGWQECSPALLGELASPETPICRAPLREQGLFA